MFFLDTIINQLSIEIFLDFPCIFVTPNYAHFRSRRMQIIWQSSTSRSYLTKRVPDELTETYRRVSRFSRVARGFLHSALQRDFWRNSPANIYSTGNARKYHRTVYLFVSDDSTRIGNEEATVDTGKVRSTQEASVTGIIGRSLVRAQYVIAKSAFQRADYREAGRSFKREI